MAGKCPDSPEKSELDPFKELQVSAGREFIAKYSFEKMGTARTDQVTEYVRGFPL